MALHDLEAKKRLGYTDKRTKVFYDGREILWGIDWQKRREELWERCDGRCEYRYADGQQCREGCSDPHHSPRKRWPVRDDRLSNLVGLCRPHHQLVDPRKPRWTKRSAQQ